MGKVQVLDSITANQIAAGEVVERPASVVKELSENSIDAKATRIEIEVRGGGKELIRITDNGSGMDASDTELCIERHATSKIRSSDDLYKISSLGFRGEALPSIAGVSRIEIRTWDGIGESGSLLSVEGGVRKKFMPAGTPQGTSIWVRDLFYNTPARYKFMKTNPTENRAILETVGHLALAHPEISFRLIIESKEVLITPGNGSLYDSIGRVLGKEAQTSLLEVKGKAAGITVTGYTSGPEVNRANRNSEIFLLNGRYIKSRMLSSAVERAYERVIPQGRFPMAVLSLTIDPSKIDVNVHPTKTEVKFEDESDIFRVVHRAVSSAIAAPGLFADTSQTRSQSLPLQQPQLLPQPQPLPQPLQPLSEDFVHTSNISTASERIEPDRHKPYGASSARKADSGYIGGKSGYGHSSPMTLREGLVSTRPVGLGSKDIYDTEYQRRDTPLHIERSEVNPVRVIGQLMNSYIICIEARGLVLIDQHNSHERIIYEGLKKNNQKNAAGVRPSQGLLVPIEFTATPDELLAVREYSSQMESAGFQLDIHENGGATVISITSIPVQIGGNPGENEFRTLLTELADTPQHFSLDLSAKESRFLATLSCKTAIKAGKPLEMAEMENLVKQLLSTDNPFTCPHGRPTVIRIDQNEIEKRLGRR